jgi:Spy/CpxP family protein refolding chaperone
MNIEQKFKWTMAGLIIMVLLNALLLATMWFQKPGFVDRRIDRPDDRSPVHQRLEQRLGLSSEQSQKISSLRRAHFMEMRIHRRSLDQKRQQYLTFIMSDEADDPQKRDSLLSELTQQFSLVEQAMYQHMTDMKQILNDDQQEAFREMMKNAISRNPQRGSGHRLHN